MTTRHIDAPTYAEFASAILRAHGVPDDDAELLADTLVTAELWGHSSHGMLRLPWYAARLRSGAMSAVTDPVTASDTGSVLVLDGRNGIGQVLTARAVEEGVRRARQHGISGVAMRNSNHFGTAAYFTRRAADQGCVTLLATNASPAMAPWGGREKAVGTNPWSIAAPAGRYGTVVMDIANTAVARGKIYLARERGEQIPPEWAADEEGSPTTDPHEAVNGLILPMAGHKGFVISFMIDVLAGVLTGSSFGASVAGPYDPQRQSGCGHLLVTIDLATMAAPEEFARRIESLIEQTKNGARAPWAEEIFFPGEIEDRTRATVERDGIAVAETTRASLVDLAGQVGVAVPATLA